MARYKETHAIDYNMPGEGNADRIKQVIKFLQNPPEDESRGIYAGPLYQESQQYVSHLQAPPTGLSNLAELTKIVNEKVKGSILQYLEESRMFIQMIARLNSNTGSTPPQFLLFASFGLRGGIRYSLRDPLFKMLNVCSKAAHDRQLVADSFQIYPPSDPWQLFLHDYNARSTPKALFYSDMKLKRLLFYHYAVPNDSDGKNCLLYPLGAFLEPNNDFFLSLKFIKMLDGVVGQVLPDLT